MAQAMAGRESTSLVPATSAAGNMFGSAARVSSLALDEREKRRDNVEGSTGKIPSHDRGRSIENDRRSSKDIC